MEFKWLFSSESVVEPESSVLICQQRNPEEHSCHVQRNMLCNFVQKPKQSCHAVLSYVTGNKRNSIDSGMLVTSK